MTDATQREAVARAIHDGPNAQAQYAAAGIARHSFDECPYVDQYFADADAALSALAPVQPTVECDTCHGSGVLGDDTCPGGCDRGARLAPAQPDPLNSQSGSNLEFAGSSQPDPLRAGENDG